MSFFELLIAAAIGTAAIIKGAEAVVNTIRSSTASMRRSAQTVQNNAQTAAESVQQTVTAMDSTVRNTTSSQKTAPAPVHTAPQRNVEEAVSQIEKQRREADKRMENLRKELEASRKELSEQQTAMRNQIAEGLNKTNNSIVQMQKDFSKKLSDRLLEQAREMDKMRTDVEGEIKKVSEDITADIKKTREQIQAQIADVRNDVAEIEKTVSAITSAGMDAVGKAEVYVDSAKGILAGILQLNRERTGITEDEIDILAADIRAAEEMVAKASQDGGTATVHGSVALKKAQEVLTSAAAMQKKALGGLVTWQNSYDAALAYIDDAIEAVKEFTGGKKISVPINDENNNSHDVKLDADEWSQGEITEILNTLQNLRDTIVSSDRVREEDLHDMLEAAQTLGDIELKDAIAKATSQIVLSGYRADIAKDMLDTLTKMGYLVESKNTYIRDDHRQPNRIAIRSVGGNPPVTAYITLTPAQDAGVDLSIEYKGCHENPELAEKMKADIRRAYQMTKVDEGDKDDNDIEDTETFRKKEKQAINTQLRQTRIQAQSKQTVAKAKSSAKNASNK